MIDAQGTVDRTEAAIASMPYRIVPELSDALPIMKPGSSTSETTGSEKRSHVSRKRLTFWAPAASIAPPMCFGSFAKTATAFPARRAKPVICDRPQPGPISKKLPRSQTSSMISRMS